MFGDGPEQWTRKQRRKWLAVLAVGTTLVYASRTCVPIVIPELAKEKKWTRTDSGAVLSSFFWGYTLTQVLGGYAADKIGGQKVIFYSALGWSIITVATPIVVENYPELLGLDFVMISRLAHGAFQGAHFPGMSSLASKRLSEKDRASFLSVATSGSAFGLLLAGSLGSFISQTFDWQTVFYVIGGMCCAWTYALHRLCRTSRETRSGAERQGVPWALLFRRPAFWSCVFAHACQTNCFATLFSWLPTFFRDVFPDAKGWLVNTIPWLFTVPCTFLGKWASERFLSIGFSVTATRKIVEAVCLLTEALGLIALDKIKTLEGVLFCTVLVTGATGFHNSAVVVNPGDLAPRHSGSVFGLMNTVGSIPGFLSVYAVGQILEKTRSWATVFNFTAAVNVFGCVLYSLFASGNPIVQ